MIKLHNDWLCGFSSCVTSRQTHPAAGASFPYCVIYISPTKALCKEVMTSWSAKFSSCGLSCLVRTLLPCED